MDGPFRKICAPFRGTSGSERGIDGLFHRMSGLHQVRTARSADFGAYFGERTSHSMERTFRFMERKAQIGSLTRDVPGHSSRAEERPRPTKIDRGRVAGPAP